VSDLQSEGLVGGGLTFGAWLARVIDSWRLVAGITSATILLSIVAMLVLAPTYRSHASFLAVSSSQSHLGVPAQYAGLAAQFGLGQNSDPGTTPPFYADLVVSQGFLTDLATSKFANPRRSDSAATTTDSVTLVSLLVPRIRDPRRALEAALKVLNSIVRVTPDVRTNMVTITVDTRWSTLSRDVANRAVALVSAFNIEKRESRARVEVQFVDSRLKEAEHDLQNAEDTLRTFYERNRLWQQSPAGILEEGRLRRRMTVANEVYLTLRREYETARIEQVDDQPVITIVDTAVAPVRRLWPRPLPVLAAAIAVGLLLGVGAAGIRVLFRDWAARNPATAADLSAATARLRRGLTGRRSRPTDGTAASGMAMPADRRL
jgi:uncharacterized protein involved in exopolysaccharide biosynthesis